MSAATACLEVVCTPEHDREGTCCTLRAQLLSVVVVPKGSLSYRWLRDDAGGLRRCYRVKALFLTVVFQLFFDNNLPAIFLTVLSARVRGPRALKITARNERMREKREGAVRGAIRRKMEKTRRKRGMKTKKRKRRAEMRIRRRQR